MSKVQQIIEDVIATATFVANQTHKELETQIAECSVGAILRRTEYQKATVDAKVSRTNGTITVKANLFDYPEQVKPAAFVEYSNARQERIESRKL